MKLLCAGYRTRFLKAIFQKDIYSVIVILAAVMKYSCWDVGLCPLIADTVLLFDGSGGLPSQPIS